MALSMDEQRILEEMERKLADDDPVLASRLTSFGRPGLAALMRSRRARIVLSLLGLIVIAALKSLGPDAGAEQIRSYIANLADFAGIDGIYDFKANPERGLGPENAIVVRYDAKAKAWTWLTKPGGEPLK